MPLDVRVCGEGQEFADVQDKSLLVSVLPYPPLDVGIKTTPFVGNMTVGGDGATINLNVDGSVNRVDAFIGPPVFGDLYITTANILIADSGALQLNRFGSGAALANGINFFIEAQNERVDISVGLKSNFDVIRVGTTTMGTGGKNDAYQLANTDSANNDGYNPIIDFTATSPGGIRLIADTQDRLGICINDDLTGVATFNIVVSGYIRLK